MLTITKLKMWKDPGYTRECVEVPPTGSRKLPVPDYSSTASMRPRKSEIMNELQIPVPFLQLKDMSYMYIEVTDSSTPTPNTMQMFGWVIEVSEVASAAESCAIRWTPDWWRTCSGDAVFGKGTVTRCDDATYKRPFMTQPRKWVKASEIANPMQLGTYLYFIIMVSESDSNGVTGFAYYHGMVDGPVDSDNHKRTFTTSEIYSGRLDEYIHDPNNDPIKPSSIIGAWIIPDVSLFPLFNDFQILSTTIGVPAYTIEYSRSKSLKQNAVVTNKYVSGLRGYGSDDMKKCIAVNPYGTVTSVIPWGFSFSSDYVDITMDVSPEGVTIYYCDHAVGFARAVEEGNYLTFTGMSIPINTNAWSEYAYTYQRSYDKRMAEIQRNQQAVSGYAGTGQSMIGGAIAGATKGSVAGAAVGAMAGGISSILGTTIGYFTQGYFNDEIQAENDKLSSNQTSNLMIGGGGIAWKELVNGWKIIQLEADAVSMAEYTAKITNDGYTVDIPVGSPSAFITAGGPLQVQNVMISGAIPPQAKTYIKNIMANGIRIVENNPTGTDPGA